MTETSKANHPDKLDKKNIEKTGVVIEMLPNATFKVRLEEGDEILAHLSGRMRLNFIRVMQGDKVVVEVSPYDTTKGRITRRF